MIIPRLALKNLLGAGLRTWLNVVVLSFVFVVIIFFQGIYNAMGEQAAHALTEAEYGGGQYWHENYDPYDPLTLEDAHGRMPELINDLVRNGQATPILIVQGTIYPEGRILPVLLKGIVPEQELLAIPSHFLKQGEDEIPALIGNRMSKNSGLKVGDYVTVQWRDSQGIFDAQEARIVQVMKTSVQSIDNGQIWIPLKRLHAMTGIEEEATLVVVGKETVEPEDIPGWNFKSQDVLLEDIKAIVQSKTVGGSIMYVILLFLAMLAIFNTQILSIFRRRKEMGTLMALGFTRTKIIQLFTLEGAMHGILAAITAAVYGIPLLSYMATKGWALPQSTDSYGFAIGEKLFPKYSAGLVIGTTVLVLIITTIVSFFPTRKIAKLKPTDALRGKLS